MRSRAAFPRYIPQSLMPASPMPSPERNVLNAQEATQWLSALASERLEGIPEERAEKVRQWLSGVARKWILREGATDAISASSAHDPAFPEWARKALGEGRSVDRLLFTRDERDQLIQITDWLRASDGPSLRTDWTRIGVEQALNSEKQWIADNVRAAERRLAAKKDQDVDAQGVSTVMSFEDGSRWVKVLSKDSLDREGALMRHCVGSYADSVAAGQIEIWSLRDSDNQPHVTIETRDGGLRQLKGFANAPMRVEFAAQTGAFLRNFENGHALEAKSKNAIFEPLSINADLSAAHFFRTPNGPIRHGVEVSQAERDSFIQAISGGIEPMEFWGVPSFTLEAQRARSVLYDQALTEQEIQTALHPSLFGMSRDDQALAPHEAACVLQAVNRDFRGEEHHLVEKMSELAQSVMFGLENDPSDVAAVQRQKLAVYLGESRQMAERCQFVRFPDATLRQWTELDTADLASFSRALAGDEEATAIWGIRSLAAVLEEVEEINGHSAKNNVWIQKKRTDMALSQTLVRASTQQSDVAAESLRDQVIAHFSEFDDPHKSMLAVESAWLSTIFIQNDENRSRAAAQRIQARLADTPELADNVITRAMLGFMKLRLPISLDFFIHTATMAHRMIQGQELASIFAHNYGPIDLAVQMGNLPLARAAVAAGIPARNPACILNALKLNTADGKAFAKEATTLLMALVEQHASSPEFERHAAERLTLLGRDVAQWVVEQPASDTEAVEFFAPFAPYVSNLFWRLEKGLAIAKLAPHLVPASAVGAVPAPAFQSIEEWRAKNRGQTLRDPDAANANDEAPLRPNSGL